MSATTWRKRDGSRVEIRKMTTDHLQHSIYMLMRSKRSELNQAGLDCYAYGGNGDMAEYYAHQEGDFLCEKAHDPLYCYKHIEHPAMPSMLTELAKRGVVFDLNRFYLPMDERVDLNKSYRIGKYLVTVTKVSA